MGSFQFSRIVVVESLEVGDFHSGTELVGYLAGLVEDPDEPPGIEHVPIESAGQFRGLLDQLAYEARVEGDRPLLHIETHGWEDATGLVFSDDSAMCWDEVREILAPLNVATEFNLVVSMAACFGGHFVQELRPGQIAPCLIVVGPTHETDGAELLGRFRDFYRVLIQSLDVPSAIKALNSSTLSTGGFLTVFAEAWFQQVLVGYVERSCTREELDRRGRDILNAVLAEGKIITKEQVRRIGHDRVRALIDDYGSRFFAFHLLPTNRERFNGALDTARARIATFITTQGY